MSSRVDSSLLIFNLLEMLGGGATFDVDAFEEVDDEEVFTADDGDRVLPGLEEYDDDEDEDDAGIVAAVVMVDGV